MFLFRLLVTCGKRAPEACSGVWLTSQPSWSASVQRGRVTPTTTSSSGKTEDPKVFSPSVNIHRTVRCPDSWLQLGDKTNCAESRNLFLQQFHTRRRIHINCSYLFILFFLTLQDFQKPRCQKSWAVQQRSSRINHSRMPRHTQNSRLDHLKKSFVFFNNISVGLNVTVTKPQCYDTVPFSVT